MKVNELSKQLGVTNKELITYLKNKNLKISSHNQNVPDDEIELAIEYFSSSTEEENDTEEVVVKNTTIINEVPEHKTKQFKEDDIIVCRSVTPWKLQAVSQDKTKVYFWNNYGDIDYVRFRDLQAMRRSEYITKPKIIIEDADLCYQWRKELGDTYKYFLGIDYPEEFFDLPDEKFRKLLTNSIDVIKDVIKITAINMIRNENYPTIQKLTIIDELLGTCLKEFI